MIRQIHIENYKSIQKLKLELGRITVLIGENGCGKSNILEAIALAGAAAGDKLDNEFLAPRGIRVTEPQLMRAAFDKNNVTQEIKISFGENQKIYFDYVLQNNNRPYSKWINKPFFKKEVSRYEIIRILELKQMLSEDSSSEVSNEIIRKIEEVEKYLEKEPDNNSEYMEIKDLSFKMKQKYLSHFLIYSPEYYCLRNFKEEGQIQPLGINGEGLFKLLQVLSLLKYFKSVSIIIIYQ